MGALRIWLLGQWRQPRFTWGIAAFKKSRSYSVWWLTTNRRHPEGGFLSRLSRLMSVAKGVRLSSPMFIQHKPFQLGPSSLWYSRFFDVFSRIYILYIRRQLFNV